MKAASWGGKVTKKMDGGSLLRPNSSLPCLSGASGAAATYPSQPWCNSAVVSSVLWQLPYVPLGVPRVCYRSKSSEVAFGAREKRHVRSITDLGGRCFPWLLATEVKVWSTFVLNDYAVWIHCHDQTGKGNVNGNKDSWPAFTVHNCKLPIAGFKKLQRGKHSLKEEVEADDSKLFPSEIITKAPLFLLEEHLLPVRVVDSLLWLYCLFLRNHNNVV
jgi:hypothetical protein